MKKTFLFILAIILFATTYVFSFSADTLPIEEVEKKLDERRNDVNEFKDYIYRLPADRDAPDVSVGYGHDTWYRITTEEYRDWNAFVEKAESIFTENMLYKALYNDWIRGEDGILYRFTPNGDIPFIEEIAIGTEIGYVKTFEFTENVYCRYIQYDKAQGYSIYRVEFWKYDKDSDEFYLLDSNNEAGFFRRGISDNRPEYKKEDYYLDYKGGVIEVGDFENYCTAVYHISRLMSDNKDILGYDLSDENVSLKVIHADENTIKVEVTLPVYEGQKVIQENQALVIIDKHFYSYESEKKYDYYSDAIGYHTHSEIIYEEIIGSYVESPDTADRANSPELPDNDRIEYLVNGARENISLYYQSSEANYNGERLYVGDLSLSDEEKQTLVDNGQGIWVSCQNGTEFAIALPEQYQGKVFEDLVSPYISAELKSYYDGNSFIRKYDSKYYTVIGFYPDFICGKDFFPENKYELIAYNGEYAVYEKEVYNSYLYYYYGAGGIEASGVDKNESYKLRLVLKYDTERGDWFIHYHELMQPPTDEFQLVKDRGEGILDMINADIPDTADSNNMIYILAASTILILVGIVNIKKRSYYQ